MIENDLFRIKPDLNWNLWVGIGSAEINIKDSSDRKYKDIEYIIDFKRFLIILSLPIPAFILWMHLDYFRGDTLFILIFLSILILNFLIMITRQKLMFNKIHKTALTKDNYDWPSILKSKSKEELKIMLREKAYYSQEILDLVKDELERNK